MNSNKHSPAAYPRLRAIAEHGLLVEFGDRIDEAIHRRVLLLDAALAAEPFAGFIEAVPAYASLTLRFDPQVTDHAAASLAIEALLARQVAMTENFSQREVAICYDEDLAPDMDAVCAATGLSRDAVIAAHLAGDYRVFMYGFAPGYAYLAGVPQALQVPRKPAAVRGVAAGSVIIAGPQCLVTTITMPTGWSIIGRSPTAILTGNDERPFLFDVGDHVRFRRISRSEYEANVQP